MIDFYPLRNAGHFRSQTNAFFETDLLHISICNFFSATLNSALRYLAVIVRIPAHFSIWWKCAWGTEYNFTKVFSGLSFLWIFNFFSFGWCLQEVFFHSPISKYILPSTLALQSCRCKFASVWIKKSFCLLAILDRKLAIWCGFLGRKPFEVFSTYKFLLQNTMTT